MSDFLDKLIERHDGGTAQIRPRLPSIFEPDPAHGRPGFAGYGGGYGKADESEDEVASEKPAPVRSAGARLLDRNEEPPVGGRHQPVRPVEKTHGDRSKSPGPRKTDEHAAGIQPTQSEPPPNHAAVIPEQETRRAEPARRLLRPLADTRIEPGGAPPAPRVAVAQQARREEGESTGKNLAVASPPPSTVKHSAPSRRGLLAPAIVPVIPAAILSETPLSRPDPVINVSIGRIEVRAATSPQRQSGKPENRSRVMGLEEYLQRRTRGNDR